MIRRGYTILELRSKREQEMRNRHIHFKRCEKASQFLTGLTKDMSLPKPVSKKLKTTASLQAKTATQGTTEHEKSR